MYRRQVFKAIRRIQCVRRDRQRGVVSSPDVAPMIEEKAISQSTPDELLRATIKEVESALAAELIPRICAASPAFFERLVVDLLLKIGYGGSRAEAGRALGKIGDGGIDGVIDQDQLGLDRIYLQAKKVRPGERG
jgi:restriction system protein